MTNRMNPIFGRGLSLQLRLFVAVLLSVAGIVADARFHLFSDVRIYMDSMVSPLLYLADSPRQLADGVSEGRADAVLAASIFHFGEYTVRQAKEYMAARGIEVRL